MKRLIGFILSIAILLAVILSGCSSSEDANPYHTLYFKDSSKSETVTAIFFNSDSGEEAQVEMEKISEDSDSYTFSCEGDCSLYNMAYIAYDDKTTSKFAFNKCVSGWYRADTYFLPYTEGEEIDYFPEMDDVTLESSFGYKKNIHIWKPEDYDASSQDKYAVIYVLDGHNLISQGEDILNYYAAAPEQVRSMIKETGNKAIVVGIENLYARDNELVPDIGVSADEKHYGERDFDSMDGSQFAQFIGETLVPYIREHYNVYADALHTSITGTSLGGLEAFYITMEYPDIFGTVGAISPSFWEYDDNTWREYLGDRTFDDRSPFVYLYTGPGVPEGTVPSATNIPKDTDPDVTDMYNRLKDMGYPEEKLVLHFNEEGEHNGLFWRAVFPEFLNAMIYQRVEPLQRETE